jgi:hypothetical protein
MGPAELSVRDSPCETRNLQVRRGSSSDPRRPYPIIALADYAVALRAQVIAESGRINSFRSPFRENVEQLSERPRGRSIRVAADCVRNSFCQNSILERDRTHDRTSRAPSFGPLKESLGEPTAPEAAKRGDLGKPAVLKCPTFRRRWRSRGLVRFVGDAAADGAAWQFVSIGRSAPRFLAN